MSDRFRLVYVCSQCGRTAMLGVVNDQQVVMCLFDEWWELVREVSS